ncbi:MAG: 2-oxoacid:acceptor oxidoreductase subunit alpha [Candidatus Aenigmarchaeota archaeon]|nr:2-oxoacid:acceptor oxidoreductase subunit alpha [Candidatus Aenigmarchaeota archaeon]
MEKIVLIGGKAGLGAARTSILLGKIFTRMGYYVFNYRDYPSLIRGGHNFNVLKISTKPVFSHDSNYDAIIAFDQLTIDLHEKKLNKDGFIIGDKSLKSDKLIPLDIDNIVEKVGVKKIFGNNAMIGALLRAMSIDPDEAIVTIEKEFKESEKAKQVFNIGYDVSEEKTILEKPDNKPKYFLTGNQAIAAGAIVGGLDIYFAYPMTPATAVLHHIADMQKKYNVNAVQLEDEISVINAALGASYAGARTMVGTSGGGFSLMTEAISMQGITEIPLVVYLSQRTGPSTGVPTYTEQGDLKFALNAGQGEFIRIVVAPGDANECFYRTAEALYLADKFRTLVILLGDKHVAEDNYTVEEFSKPILHDKFIINPNSDYKSYELTSTGISPRAVPGQGAVVRASSYEHDEYGYTVEDEEKVKLMKDKRILKLKPIIEEINKLNPITVYGTGDNLIVGWGSTKGAIIDALNELENTRFLQISYISPFPAELVEKELKNSKNIILIENNQTGLLGDIIREKTGIKIENKLLKYNGRPFTKKEIIDGVSKWLK